MKTVLTIGPSDSIASGGIQGDLKVFSAMGIYGVCALTAVEARGTRGVYRELALPPRMVEAQIDAVARDLAVAAVKVGALPSWQCVEALGARLRRRRLPNVVLDPRIVSPDGERRLGARAVVAVRECLLPRTRVATLGGVEAALLAGAPITTADEARAAAAQIRLAGAGAVVISGEELGEPGPALLLDSGPDTRLFPWISGQAIGLAAGTLSAAIAARLALGDEVMAAVEFAAAFAVRAAERAIRLGRKNPLLIAGGPTDIIKEE